MNQNIRQLLRLNDPDVVIPEIRKVSTDADAIIKDVSLMKDLINSSFLVASYGTNKVMQNGGWEGLIDGGNLNEELLSILKSPAIYLYTQIMTIELIALLSEEKKNEAKSTDSKPE